MEDVVTLEGVDGVAVLVDVLVLLHALANALAQVGPLLLVLLVPLLHGLAVLKSDILLLTDHLEVFSEFDAFLFLFVDVLIELVDSLLKVVNLVV